MEVTAKLNYLRVAPRKTRLLADLIRGKSVEEARSFLNFTVKKSAEPFLKLLNQAVVSASNNFQLDPENLYIAKVIVDEGPKYKRWRPRARGQAYQIQKKTSHLFIVLSEKKKSKKKDRPVPQAKADKGKPEVVPEKEIIENEKEKTDKPKFSKARKEAESTKPKIEKGGIRRIFRRKAF